MKEKEILAHLPASQSNKLGRWLYALLAVVVICLLGLLALYSESLHKIRTLEEDLYIDCKNQEGRYKTQIEESSKKLDKLQYEYDKLKGKYNDIVASFPIEVTDIKLGNYLDGRPLIDYTSIKSDWLNWNAGSIYYLRPKIKIKVRKAGTYTVAYKIYKHQSLEYNYPYTSEFTGSPDKLELSEGEGEYTLHGWGRSSGGTYSPGQHYIEIWVDSKCLLRDTFKLL